MSYRSNQHRFTSRTLLFPALTFALVLCAHAEIKKNVAYPGFQLLEEPVSPRHLAMGSAGTAGNGSGFAYYNPAMPFLNTQRYLTAEYGRSPGDLQRAHFETAIPFSSWYIAAAIHTETISDIFGTSFDGNLPEYNIPFSSQLSNVSIGLGYIKNDLLSVALSLSGIQERIEKEYAYAASISAGLAYKLIPDKFHVGLAAFHLGKATSFLDSTMDWGEGSALPMSGRLGVSWQDTLKMIPYTFQGDIVFRNADKRVMVPVGLEVRPIQPLALRIGKRLNHDTEIFNIGCGIDISPLSADVSFVIPKLRSDTELKWLVGVTYTLKSSSKSTSSNGSSPPASMQEVQDRPLSSESASDTLSKIKENKDLSDSAPNSIIEEKAGADPDTVDCTDGVESGLTTPEEKPDIVLQPAAAEDEQSGKEAAEIEGTSDPKQASEKEAPKEALDEKEITPDTGRRQSANSLESKESQP